MDNVSIPLIISVDDHVLEDPELWTSRVPKRMIEAVPHVEHARALPNTGHRNVAAPLLRSQDDGEPCDWWIYEDKEVPLITAVAAIGIERSGFDPITYDQIAPSCWRQEYRLKAMDDDGIGASICYPNLVPRFCGQTFLEASDKEVALECVRAYNDWILDEWCGGDGQGKLLPLTIMPLWDVELAVAEIERCANRGTIGVAFSENPYMLGLPSIFSGYWDPVFRAVAAHNVTLCMHVGSSSKVPTTSPDSAHIVTTCTHFSVTAGSLLDFVFSGTLDRIPELKLFFAESQAGWMPFIFEQADWLWAHREGSDLGSGLRNAPTSYIKDRVFTSIYNDKLALRLRDLIGIGQICFETDFPHSVSTFPDTRAIAIEHCQTSDLSDEDAYMLMRGSAIRAFDLGRVGITQ